DVGAALHRQDPRERLGRSGVLHLIPEHGVVGRDSEGHAVRGDDGGLGRVLFVEAPAARAGVVGGDERGGDRDEGRGGDWTRAVVHLVAPFTAKARRGARRARRTRAAAPAAKIAASSAAWLRLRRSASR